MRLHDVAILTEDALGSLEVNSGNGIAIGKDAVFVDPAILWLLVQTYRDHHDVHRSRPVPVPNTQ